MVETRSQLVVLTKAPRAGGGKSRLAASLGVEAAAELATAFLRDTVAEACSDEWTTSVHYTPTSGRAEIHSIVTGVSDVSGVELVPQSEGDLGERILGAMANSVAQGASTVLIGSDTPGLPRRIIAEAFAELGDHPLVLGPATDGGFYLIGLTRMVADLFDGVAWSTDLVFETVMKNAERLGLGVTLLEEWRDIDDEESLFALAADLLERDENRAPATLRVVERHVRLPSEAAS